ncbi:MAG: DUF1289 domain-containing protein [Burkholderiales bacterium]
MSAPPAAAAPRGRGDVPSPCINVCRMNDATGLCEGCFRTLDEIAGWSGYTRAEKLAARARAEARKPAAR